jgi:hypothetical protein
MKFDLQKAIDGHPLEYDSKPVTLRAVRFDAGEILIYVSTDPSELPYVFHKDGSPATDDNTRPLTLAQPLREVYIVLFPGNEARYLHSLEAATALAAGGKGAGPYALTVRLPWDVATRIDSERASALLARA